MANSKVKLKFKSWHYQCGDGCCDDFGTDVFVNDEIVENEDGLNINSDYDTEGTIKYILEKLGYEVEIENTYEYE